MAVICHAIHYHFDIESLDFVVADVLVDHLGLPQYGDGGCYAVALIDLRCAPQFQFVVARM